MEKKNEVTYKVTEENKEDFRLSTIEQTGHTSLIRIKDIDDHKKRMSQELTEATAQIRIHAAEMFNIEKNHPFVKDFTALQLHTLELYTRALSEMQKLEEYIDARYKAFDEYKNIEKEIYGALDFDLKDVTPVHVPRVEDDVKKKPIPSPVDLNDTEGTTA